MITSRSRWLLALVAALVSSTIAVGAAEAQEPPPTEDTAVLVPSIESGPPGISVGLSGTCWWLGMPNEAAFIRLSRIVTDGELPFDTSIELPVQSNGSFSGQLVVPVEAPQGEYTLSLNCRTEDQLIGFFDTTFTVAGDPITTTSTSSTTTAVVQPPGGGGGSIEPPFAPPATPSPGTPTYTG